MHVLWTEELTIFYQLNMSIDQRSHPRAEAIIDPFFKRGLSVKPEWCHCFIIVSGLVNNSIQYCIE